VRIYVLSHALLFVAGFTLVFVILFGVPATVLGHLAYAQRGLVAGLGGALMVVLGLHLSGFFREVASLAARGGPRLEFLAHAAASVNRTLDAFILPERRLGSGKDMSPGYARSVIVGITFAAGWTPCIGPLLGLVLALAAANPGQAIPLLLAYSAGLATPFLLTAALLSTAIDFLKRLNRYMRVIEVVSGLLLVIVGILLVQGTLSALNALFNVTPAWLTEVESGLAADASALTLPVAALAGLLSFLSPCVLPLVPVYLGYLSGTVVGRTPAMDAHQSARAAGGG
jgi:cytochrome c-type biogenesis protein